MAFSQMGVASVAPPGKCSFGKQDSVSVRQEGTLDFFNKKKGVEIERNMILLRLQKQIGELKRWSNVQNKFIFLSSAFKNKTWKSFKGRSSTG